MQNDDPDSMPDITEEHYELRQLRNANWIIANCTSPANFFHLLRRQVALPFRKPVSLSTLPRYSSYNRSPQKLILLFKLTKQSDFVDSGLTLSFLNTFLHVQREPLQF